jgi:hypothetical protein
LGGLQSGALAIHIQNRLCGQPSTSDLTSIRKSAGLRSQFVRRYANTRRRISRRRCRPKRPAQWSQNGTSRQHGPDVLKNAFRCERKLLINLFELSDPVAISCELEIGGVSREVLSDQSSRFGWSISAVNTQPAWADTVDEAKAALVRACLDWVARRAQGRPGRTTGAGGQGPWQTITMSRPRSASPPTQSSLKNHRYGRAGWRRATPPSLALP